MKDKELFEAIKAEGLFHTTCRLMKERRATLPTDLCGHTNFRGTTYKSSTVRHGDFDIAQESGNFYTIRCRRCGLSGRLALPEDCKRDRCPRCQKIDVAEWQQLGFGSLVPVEKVVKPLVVATIDAEDDPEEINDGGLAAGLESPTVAPIAGEDSPNLDDIEPELDIDSWTQEERERADPAGVFLEIETESGIA